MARQRGLRAVLEAPELWQHGAQILFGSEGWGSGGLRGPVALIGATLVTACWSFVWICFRLGVRQD
jgi:hypothetical protein